MKARTFSFASRLAVLALAVISFASCSKDKDEEPSIDEILSEETTPITFELPTGNVTLFDYAGNRFIESDTFKIQSRNGDSRTLELRQGKHKLLWFVGLDVKKVNEQDDFADVVHYDPQSKSVYATLPYVSTTLDLRYCQKEIEIFPYLMPTQKLTFQPLTASIKFNITDSSPLVNQGKKSYTAIGEIKGVPAVVSMGITTGEYKRDEQLEKNFIPPLGIYAIYNSVTGKQNIEAHEYLKPLCPFNGIDNIQLIPDVKDDNGRSIPTTTLPKISLRRGYTTVLTGPLFSGSTSDWTVTMEEWK